MMQCRHSSTVVFLGGLPLAIAMLCGCSGREFAVAPVTGKITLQGKPVAGGGRVRFIPLDAKGEAREGKAAMGELAADGTFRLTTYGASDGAIVGEHRVEVVQNHVLEPAQYAPEPGEGGAAPTPVLIRPAILVPPDVRIAAIYAGGNSPLRATVAESDNEVHFDLQQIE